VSVVPEPEPLSFEPEPVSVVPEPEPLAFERAPVSFEPEPVSFEPDPLSFGAEAAPVMPAWSLPETVATEPSAPDVPRQFDPITEVYAPPTAQSLPPVPPAEPWTALLGSSTVSDASESPSSSAAVVAEPAPAVPEAAPLAAPAVPATDPIPVPAPVPSAGKSRRALATVAFAVVVLILLGAIGWVLYQRISADPTKNTQAGACLAGLPTLSQGQDQSVNAARVVDCNDPAAAYYVEGRLDSVSDAQAKSSTVCQAYPAATVFYRPTNGTTYVLCLRPLTK
jgi:hypothetical protein